VQGDGILAESPGTPTEIDERKLKIPVDDFE
jgi:hypothetical protein